MRKVLPWIAVLGLLAALYAFREPVYDWGVAAWDLLTGRTAASPEPQVLVASGTLEARDLAAAARTGGRVVALKVSEGQRVAAGELIAQLDTALLDAQVAEAAAAVRVAQAQVRAVRAGVREADLDVVRATVTQAEAVAAAAHVAAADAEAAVTAPGELDVQIAQAGAGLEVTAEQVKAAEASARAADLEQELWGRIVQRLEQGTDVALPPELGGGTRHVDAPADQLANARFQWNLKSQAAWTAHAQHVTAIATAEAARQRLADLRAQKADPVALRGQAATAAAAATVADAGTETARSNVALAAAGATAEQIASSEAVVAQAQAAQAALEATRPQYEVLAPAPGVITDAVLGEGEVAAAGAVVVHLADLGEMTMTAYVPEPRLGEVRAGQAAAIRVDAFPGRSFAGAVRAVANEPQFTPKNVLSREERADTVFAVTIDVANADGALKAGMPADAAFCAAADGCVFPFESVDQGSSEPTPTPSRPRYSGAIEANTVAIASELSGRATTVAAAEGDAVTAGQVLVTLDGAELAAQRAQVEAAVDAAEAELARVRARPQAERVSQAEAAVRQAEAALDAAQARLDAARAQREHPQELDSQVNAARRQVRTATAAVDSARAAVKTAQVLQESLPNPGSDEDKTRRAVYDAQAEAAAAGLRAAAAQVRGAQATLNQLQAVRDNPIALDAAVHAAEGAVNTAQAQVAAARAQLAQVKAPAHPAQVAVAQARVAQAEAARARVDAGLAKLEVRTPLAGQVVTQAIRAGEVVNAGATLFTVAELSTVRLAVYVPVSDLGAVVLGGKAHVAVDAYPGRSFEGAITHVEEEAQFTPQNIQTVDERARLVVAVEVTLANPDGALRAGMAAEAWW